MGWISEKDDPSRLQLLCYHFPAWSLCLLHIRNGGRYNRGMRVPDILHSRPIPIRARPCGSTGSGTQAILREKVKARGEPGGRESLPADLWSKPRSLLLEERFRVGSSLTDAPRQFNVRGVSAADSPHQGQRTLSASRAGSRSPSRWGSRVTTGGVGSRLDNCLKKAGKSMVPAPIARCWSVRPSLS